MDSYFQSYIINEYTNFHLRSIYLAKKYGLEIESYLKLPYDSLQLEQIYLGLVDGVNVDKYSDIRFGSEQMNEIRLGLVEGIDVDVYTSLDYSEHTMKKLRRRLTKELLIKIRSHSKNPNQDQDVVELDNDDQLKEKMLFLKESLRNSNPLDFEDALDEIDTSEILKFNF